MSLTSATVPSASSRFPEATQHRPYAATALHVCSPADSGPVLLAILASPPSASPPFLRARAHPRTAEQILKRHQAANSTVAAPTSGADSAGRPSWGDRYAAPTASAALRSLPGHQRQPSVPPGSRPPGQAAILPVLVSPNKSRVRDRSPQGWPVTPTSLAPSKPSATHPKLHQPRNISCRFLGSVIPRLHHRLGLPLLSPDHLPS